MKYLICNVMVQVCGINQARKHLCSSEYKVSYLVSLNSLSEKVTLNSKKPTYNRDLGD